MSKLSGFFSKDNAEKSFRKRRTIGNLIISIVPVLLGLYALYEALPFKWEGAFTIVFVVFSWLATELVLINYFYKLNNSPKYIHEVFQLSLLINNLWFMWLIVFQYVKFST